jgi:catechol 2,3-dioxygenase-like lactoylglutathione lyase family enzyme
MNSTMKCARIGPRAGPAVLLALTVQFAVAQAPDPGLSGIAHVAIRVSSLDQARAFFHKLGFDEAFAIDQGGPPTEAFFKVNDRQFIELYPRRDAAGAVGFMHVCFEAADINSVYQSYVAHGLSPTPVKRAGAGNLLFTLQGPEEPGPPAGLRPAPTQNIEYTQYMPGSRHTLDRGRHLGPDRIADRIAGVAIPVTDLKTATALYVEELSFAPATRPLETGTPALALPGTPAQRIELLASTASTNGNASTLPFRLIFSVPDLRHAAKQLLALDLRVKREHSSLVIEDPDGDSMVFLEDRIQAGRPWTIGAGRTAGL